MIKCFDIVSMVTDEASARFAPLFKEDPERKDILREYCEALDVVAEECSADSIEAEVHEIEMTIAIRIESADITVSKNHIFYELVDRALSVRYFNSGNDSVITEFIYPSIWQKV